MSYTKQEQKTMVEVLKGKRFKEAFLLITDRNWWADGTMTNDTERENFLYSTYFDYHHLLFIEGIKGVETVEGNNLMHQLKIQLDIELQKVKNGIYESEEE